MTDKERLEEIKEKYNFGSIDRFVDVKLVNPQELKWLIEQVERVEELEEEVDRLNGALHYQLSQENIRNEENRKLKYKNKRYRETIEEAIEYANSPKILTSPAGIEEILSKSLEGDNEWKK